MGEVPWSEKVESIGCAEIIVKCDTPIKRLSVFNSFLKRDFTEAFNILNTGSVDNSTLNEVTSKSSALHLRLPSIYINKLEELVNDNKLFVELVKFENLGSVFETTDLLYSQEIESFLRLIVLLKCYREDFKYLFSSTTSLGYSKNSLASSLGEVGLVFYDYNKIASEINNGYSFLNDLQRLTLLLTIRLWVYKIPYKFREILVRILKADPSFLTITTLYSLTYQLMTVDSFKKDFVNEVPNEWILSFYGLSIEEMLTLYKEERL